MKTLKVLSALLSYPDADLAAAAPELRAALEDDRLLDADALEAVEALIDELAQDDLFDVQERYIQLFDRTRSLSLHLFEHVHGESRDRGQAMVDLISLYEEGGFLPTVKELPDYIPLFLEYAAMQKPSKAVDLIAQPSHVFAALAERLAKRHSSYAGVFRALVVLGHTAPDAALVDLLMQEPESEPDDLKVLDAAWAEEEVLFGPGAAAADCGKDSLIARVRQARRPAPGLPSTRTSNKPVVLRSGHELPRGA